MTPEPWEGVGDAGALGGAVRLTRPSNGAWACAHCRELPSAQAMECYWCSGKICGERCPSHPVCPDFLRSMNSAGVRWRRVIHRMGKNGDEHFGGYISNQAPGDTIICRGCGDTLNCGGSHQNGNNPCPK